MDQKIITIIGYLVVYWAIFMPALHRTVQCILSLEYEDFLTMKWNPGDRISCTLSGIGGFFGFQHWMLGIDNSSRVIHINRAGQISLHDKSEVDLTAFQNKYCNNHGPGAYGTDVAVNRADSWNRRVLHYYNLFWCNCRHWVEHWANGYEQMFCPLY